MNVYQYFRGPYSLHHQGDGGSKDLNFYHTKRRYKPEDSHLHTHRHENLRSYIPKWFLKMKTNMNYELCTNVMFAIWGRFDGCIDYI
jgi:hypothetical protein